MGGHARTRRPAPSAGGSPTCRSEVSGILRWVIFPLSSESGYSLLGKQPPPPFTDEPTEAYGDGNPHRYFETGMVEAEMKSDLRKPAL